MHMGLSGREEARMRWEDAGRTKQTRERTSGVVGGKACCYHGKLMPGQTEPDLHPNTVLIADLLCWDSLILLDIDWPSLWYGKQRWAVHTPGSPQGTLRVGETEVEGSWEMSHEGCLGRKVLL